MDESPRKAGVRWDLEVVRPVCIEAARAALPAFRGLPAFGFDDLLNEALLHAWKVHGRFRARQGQKQGEAGGGGFERWLFWCVKRRLVDLVRSARADQKRAEACARSNVFLDVELALAAYGLSRRLRNGSKTRKRKESR